jgi:hypothetical protein
MLLKLIPIHPKDFGYNVYENLELEENIKFTITDKIVMRLLTLENVKKYVKDLAAENNEGKHYISKLQIKSAIRKHRNKLAENRIIRLDSLSYYEWLAESQFDKYMVFKISTNPEDYKFKFVQTKPIEEYCRKYRARDYMFNYE